MPNILLKTKTNFWACLYCQSLTESPALLHLVTKLTVNASSALLICRNTGISVSDRKRRDVRADKQLTTHSDNVHQDDRALKGFPLWPPCHPASQNKVTFLRKLLRCVVVHYPILIVFHTHTLPSLSLTFSLTHPLFFQPIFEL